MNCKVNGHFYPCSKDIRLGDMCKIGKDWLIVPFIVGLDSAEKYFGHVTEIKE